MPVCCQVVCTYRSVPHYLPALSIDTTILHSVKCMKCAQGDTEKMHMSMSFAFEVRFADVQEAINALPEAERPEVICSASAVGKCRLTCCYTVTQLSVSLFVICKLCLLTSCYSLCFQQVLSLVMYAQPPAFGTSC